MEKRLILCAAICGLLTSTMFSSDANKPEEESFVELSPLLPLDAQPILLEKIYICADSPIHESFVRAPSDPDFANLSMSDDFDSNNNFVPIILPEEWERPADDLKKELDEITVAKLDAMIAEIEAERGELNIKTIELPFDYLVERWHAYLKNPIYRQKIQQKLAVQYRKLPSSLEKSYVIRRLAEHNKQALERFKQAQERAILQAQQEDEATKKAKTIARTEPQRVLKAYKAFEE